MKFLRIFIPIVAVIYMCSCEGNTRREFIIQNNTVYDLNAAGSGFLDQSFNKNISPGSQKSILITESRGGNSNAGKPAEYIESLLIYYYQDTVSKDYKIESNWIISSSQLKKIPSQYEHTFVFEVSENDF